jgi:hypothetical protein
LISNIIRDEEGPCRVFKQLGELSSNPVNLRREDYLHFDIPLLSLGHKLLEFGKENRIKNIIILLTLFGVNICSVCSWALSDAGRALITYETKYNAAAERSNEAFILENYEIPLRLVDKDVAARTDARILNSLIFEKNGEKYLRWVINPEDTKWYLEVEKWLRGEGLSTNRHKYFEGYQTASRSYIVVDPKTGVEFSVKVSTDNTGGSWTDKKQEADNTMRTRLIIEYIHEVSRKIGGFKHIILVDEPAGFGIRSIDQGMVVRVYDGLGTNGCTFVPGFSIMHEKMGTELAKLNGSDDPKDYWNEHYNKPLARAFAEYFAATGMTYTSAHSQNFLVELDQNKKPTGKIVFRDPVGSYISRPFFEGIGRRDILDKWLPDEIVGQHFDILVNLLYGNVTPNWWWSAAWGGNHTWPHDFFKEFRFEFTRLTGMDLGFQADDFFTGLQGQYYFDRVDMTSPTATRFIRAASEGKQFLNPVHSLCEQIFLRKVEAGQ